MRERTIAAVALVLTLAWLVHAVVSRRERPQRTEMRDAAPPRVSRLTEESSRSAPSFVPPREAARPRPARPTVQVDRPAPRPAAAPPVPDANSAASANDQAKPAKPKQPKEKSIERLALAEVGLDPLAEAVWLGAINSPDTPARDRHDLIEDLNEDGFPNPRHPTVEDLPMIVNRLALIEQEAPFAMDKVNADAFAEAYKDLVNMYAKVINE